MKNLVIDIGTTTIKCAIFEDGVLKDYFGEEYSLSSVGPHITQDFSDWVNLIKKGIKSFGELGDIGGVCISSQGITILPVDKKGVPLSKAVSWLDTSAKKEFEEFEKSFDKDYIFELTGKKMLPCYSLFKIKNMVDNKVGAYKFLMPSDYINFLLTGEYYTDYTMASGTMLFDISKRIYDKKLLEYCNIDENMLGTPVEMGEKIGEVTQKASNEFGIPAGTPVIMGAQDQKISAYACDISENVATVSIGTSTAVSVLKKSNEQMSVFSYNKKDLIYEAALNTTGAAIKWLKNLAFSNYEEMDNAAKKAKDNNGITFLSDFSAGAGINNISLSTDKGHIVNALYEDIAKRIKKLLPQNVTKLVVFGGGAKSRVLLDTISSITACEIEVPESVEVALQGADLLIRNYHKKERKTC